MEPETKAMNQVTSLIGLTALLALLSSGCMQEPLCPELSSCGGPVPVGSWQLQAGYESCTEDLYVPPTDPRLRGGEVPVARQPIIEPAFYDWCTNLLTNGGMAIQTRPATFIPDSTQLGSASITYTPADPANPTFGIFNLGTVRVGTYYFDFPAYCMRAFGAMDGRDAYDSAGMSVSNGPTNVCKQLEVPLNTAGVGEGAFRNIVCNPNPADPAGCLCQYDVAGTSGVIGNYQVLDSTTIMHTLSTSPPNKATYCNKGSTLEMTGYEGSYLFGIKGLRTLTMVKQ
jgi:hypothetical protein